MRDMSVVVNPEEIVGKLEMANDQTDVFLNIRTGEFVYLSEFGVREENEELAEEIDANEEDYVRLPSSYDIHEYHIMKCFIESLEDETVKARLSRAIRGRGAFRCFKDTICELDVREDWFVFKSAALRDIAIAWCKENGIAFSE